MGAKRANMGRLVVATLFLGAWAHLAAFAHTAAENVGGVSGQGFWLFFISGVAGMGLGDIAVFAALPLLGARLTVVMTQCLAAPIAALTEWWWLGTALTPAQIGCSTVVLAGVALALTPSRAHPPRVSIKFAGVIFGLGSALGQGLGAVLSRKAYDVTKAAAQTIDGLTAAYQRILGGLVVTLIFYALLYLWRKSRQKRDQTTPSLPEQRLGPTSGSFFHRWRWTLANGLSGAVIGVSCYQWALSTTASGIVLPIVATTPLVVVPLAYWLDGERPTRRSLIGGAIAVAAAVALRIVR